MWREQATLTTPQPVGGFVFMTLRWSLERILWVAWL